MTTMLDEILEKGLGHLRRCNITLWDEYQDVDGEGWSDQRCREEFGEYECTCGADKRRKYLERLKEPTEEMKNVGERISVMYIPGGAMLKAELTFRDMLAKAEEVL